MPEHVESDLHRRFQPAGEGRVEPKRDSVWHADMRRELIGGILATERVAAPANLLCWLMVALAVTVTHDWVNFLVPLCFRLTAMAATRTSFARLRRRLETGGPYCREEKLVVAALFIAGCAWGSTLIPLVILHKFHVVSLLATGATTVGLGLIVSLLAPIRRWAIVFGSGVLLTSIGGIGVTAPSLLPFALMDEVGLSAVVLTYSFAAMASQRQSAQLLVDNIRLGEGLNESLAQMKALALGDMLTGLPNRRALFEHVAALDRSAARTVILLDIDWFKSINDRFGHAAGDQVLAAAGRAISSTLDELGPGTGFAARIGGEEFAIVLEGGKSRTDLAATEKFREAVRANSSGFLPGLGVTASAGVATWVSSEPFEDALSRADAALYRAKAGGRDRTAA